MQTDNIKVPTHIGTWYVIDKTNWQGKQVYLLEHEKYGDSAACIIVDENLNIILEEVWNGFDDLVDFWEENKMETKYYATYTDYRNTPQYVIDKILNNELLEQLGGFKSHDNCKIILDIKYDKEVCDRCYNDVAYMHILSAKVTLVNNDDIQFYKDPPAMAYFEPRKSRWDRFKQFVKGE